MSSHLTHLEGEQRKRREAIEDAIRTIRASTLCARDAASLRYLGQMELRLRRLRELSNEQELGAFQIQCRQTADAVFQALE